MNKNIDIAVVKSAAVAATAAVLFTACAVPDLEQTTTASIPDIGGITQETPPPSTLPDVSANDRAVFDPVFSHIGNPIPKPPNISEPAAQEREVLDTKILYGVLYAVAVTGGKEGSKETEFAYNYLVGVTDCERLAYMLSSTKRGVERVDGQYYLYTRDEITAVLDKAQLSLSDLGKHASADDGADVVLRDDYVRVKFPDTEMPDFKPSLISREENTSYVGAGVEYRNEYAYVQDGTARRIVLVTLERGDDVSVADFMML